MLIEAFLTAYDPTDLPGASVDPLGFERGYLFLADRILPGLTNVANRPRYFGVMCAGLRLAQSLDADTPRGLYEARLSVLLRLERLWALANVLADPDGQLSGLRGVRYARRAAEQLEDRGADRTDGDYKLLSRQVPYGAVGMYGVVGDGFRFFDRHALELTPGLGERLGDGFLTETATPKSVRKSAVDGTSVRLNDLQSWGARCHLDTPPGPEEQACLHEALDRDPVRARMARRLEETRPLEGESEQGRLARILATIGKDASDQDLAEALRAILAFERAYRLLQLVFERLLWLARNDPSGRADRTRLETDSVLTTVRHTLPEAAAALEEALAASTLVHAPDSERVRDAASFVAEAAGQAGSPTALVESVVRRHADVQHGKVTGGRRKAPWLEWSEGGLALTLARVGGASRPLEREEEIGSHPYRLSAADNLIAASRS